MQAIIKENTPLTNNIFQLKVLLPTKLIITPGQFFNILIPTMYLRRPLSVANVEDHTLTFIYRVIGKGTAVLSSLQKGYVLDILGPLGNGYVIQKHKQPILVGGGLGIPPLYYLAKTLLQNNIQPTIVLGYRSKDEAFMYTDFINLSPTIITSNDGSIGLLGTVLDHLPSCDYIYACGPQPMLENITKLPTPSQVCLEERMGCGFGACRGCTIHTKQGHKQVCKDGPVFEGDVLQWED